MEEPSSLCWSSSEAEEEVGIHGLIRFFFFLFFHGLDMSKTQIKETSCRESPALRKDPLASGEIGTVKPDSGQGVMTVLW